MPQELKEPICTLIWTALRTDVKELNSIRELLAAKFGQNLDHEALCNVDNCVNAKVMERLGPEPPEEVMVFSFLNSIAEEYDLDWRAVEAKEIPDDDPLEGLEEESIDFSSVALDLDACLPSVPGSSSTSESAQRSIGEGAPAASDLISMSEPGLQHAQPMVAPVLHQVTDLGAKGVPSSVDDFESMFAAVPSAVSSSSRSVADEFFAGGPPTQQIPHVAPMAFGMPPGGVPAQQHMQMPQVPPMGGAIDVAPPMAFGLRPNGGFPGGGPPGGYPGAGVLQMPEVPMSGGAQPQAASEEAVSADPPNMSDAELEAEFEKLMQLSPRDSGGPSAAAVAPIATQAPALAFPTVPPAAAPPAAGAAIDFPSLPVQGTKVETSAEYDSLFDDEPQPVSNPSLAETGKSLSTSLGRGPAPGTSGQAAPIKLPGMPSSTSSAGSALAPLDRSPAEATFVPATAESAAWPTMAEPTHAPPPPPAEESVPDASTVPEDWASKFGLAVEEVAPHPSGMGSWAALDPQAGAPQEPQLSSQEPASTMQEDDMDDLFSRLSALKQV